MGLFYLRRARSVCVCVLCISHHINHPSFDRAQDPLSIMVKNSYSKEAENPTKSCKARCSDLRIHYKNTHEPARAIKGMGLLQAQKYLEDVLEHKAAIPFRRHRGGIGRAAQAKIYGTTQCRWPKKSVEAVLGLLKNAESNAESKNLDLAALEVTHIQVQQAPKMRRRTYRAHGRINPYMSCPCHVEMILSEKDEVVRKAAEPLDKKAKKVSKKKLARQRLRTGAGEM